MDKDFDGLVIFGFGFEFSVDDVFSSRIGGYISLDEFVLVVEGEFTGELDCEFDFLDGEVALINFAIFFEHGLDI